MSDTPQQELCLLCSRQERRSRPVRDDALDGNNSQAKKSTNVEVVHRKTEGQIRGYKEKEHSGKIRGNFRRSPLAELSAGTARSFTDDTAGEVGTGVR